MDRGAWRATVPGVSQNRTRVSDLARTHTGYTWDDLRIRVPTSHSLAPAEGGGRGSGTGEGGGGSEGGPALLHAPSGVGGQRRVEMLRPIAGFAASQM